MSTIEAPPAPPSRAAAVASIVATYFEIFPLDMLFWLLSGMVATLVVDRSRPLTG